MGWHYDEAEAGRVGHPWANDAAWGTIQHDTGVVEDVGLFVMFVLVGTIVVVMMAMVAVASAPIACWRRIAGKE